MSIRIFSKALMTIPTPRIHDMKGVYSLIISNKKDQEIPIGARGPIYFKKGYWIYVGSAQGTGSTNLKNRLQRHFRKDKKIHWHIDHLLIADVELIEAIWAGTDENCECVIAAYLGESDLFQWGPIGFGAGDCRTSCKSHLFLYKRSKDVIATLEGVFENLGLIPRKYSDLV
ncbi:MAG: GIY-YIG nuclease family protein [Candidatus Thorarchaeota archaeon]|nr:GIY-YIG nuclease family protein [Candidatus Thorarchaeota archaeon]